MSNEAIRYFHPENPNQQRYPITNATYEQALMDLEKYADGPKNKIIAIKGELKEGRTDLYWHLSRTSTMIDEYCSGPDGMPINSGAFVSGIYMFRALELNAERKKMPMSGEITADDIANHNANNKGLTFEQRWEKVNQEEPDLHEKLTRLFGFLGKPDCVESRMGAVEMYELFREQAAKEQFNANDTFQYE